jgi:hypothetical protein
MPLSNQQLTKDWRSYPPEVKEQLLAQVNAQLARTVGAAFKRKYRNDRVAFIHDCVDWREGESPAGYQDEIFAALDQYLRVAVRGPHGIGKTMIAALAVLHFALTRDGEDWKTPTTASAFRQLSKFLWPEIHKWSRRLKWDKILREQFSPQSELLTLNLKLSTGEAFAVASSNYELIEGAHADTLLYVFDEAKAIANDVFDTAEGAFAHGECFALAISTPGSPAGRFYDIHTRKPGLEAWWVRHVTLSEAIEAGRISKAWAEDKKRLWGENSAVYHNRVLGDFHDSDEDGLIPLAWIEAANERWLNWNEQEDSQKWLPFTCVGVDVARSMDGDKTVLALRHEDVITELRRYSEADTMSIVGHVAGVLNKRGGLAVVDVIGVGGGPFDRLREQNFKVQAFNSSAAAPSRMTDRSGELEFLNTRAAAWWSFRERLDPAYGATAALPPDDLLIGDLTAPHWKTTSAGKIQVESKDEIRKRLGRSTDDGDAVVMAFYQEPEVRDRYTKEDGESWGYRSWY